MKTKIIATIGPRSADYESMKQLARAGTEIFRVNFSHPSRELLKSVKKAVKRIRKETGVKIKVMQDLQGPRLRVGALPEDGIELARNAAVTFKVSHAASAQYDGMHIPIIDRYLHKDMQKGEPLYLANGDIEVTVRKIAGNIISGVVKHPGTLYSHKGINVPMTKMRMGGLTKKDIADAEYGLSVADGPDYMALSFVDSAKDVIKLRTICKDHPGIKIIAKIERLFALQHIDEIIQAADGIMFARGDLGIEVPMEDVPIIQRDIIHHAHWHNKPIIIATQMMLSMMKETRPTRAEVSDVANAVYAGADGIMLSEETAMGDHPVHVVATMRRIADRMERELTQHSLL